MLGFVPLANLLQGAPYVPWWSVAAHEWLVTGTALLLVAWLLALLLGRRLDRLGDRVMRLALAPSPGAFVLLAGCAAFVLTAALGLYCFARQPFSQDEMTQRFHAHLLLSGRLFALGEAHPEFFSAAGTMDRAGRFTTHFPVGGPAVLALGMAVHAVWLVNPLLTALMVRNLHRFAADAYGESVARAAVLLFLVSPFVLIMGASEMNHISALAFGTLALAALPAWTSAATRGSALRAAALIGLGVGAMATIRPLDAVLVAGVIGLFQLSLLVREPHRWRSIGVQTLAAALPLAVLLFANARTTGHPLLFAYTALNGPNERLGFHLDPLGRPHTPLHGLILASANLMRLNRFLFEWPLPGLLPIVVAWLLLPRVTRWDLLLIGLVGAVLGGYALYWFDGFFAGPRFMFTAVPALVLSAARSPGLLARRLRGTARRAVFLVLPLCAGWAWIVPTGVSSAQMETYYYHEGRTKLKTVVAPVVRSAHLRNALVFVHESWRARLDARLKALGLTPGQSEHILTSSDACQVQGALDAEEARTPRDTAGRAARLWAATRPSAPIYAVAGLAADEQVLLAEGRTLTPVCMAEIRADTVGVAPFAPFLELEGLDREGALGGDVVFARDFGSRNELLRSRFPNRVWYRYRSPRFLNDTAAAFLPY